MRQAYQIDGNVHIANEYLSYAIHEFLRFEHFEVDHFYKRTKVHRSKRELISLTDRYIAKVKHKLYTRLLRLMYE